MHFSFTLISKGSISEVYDIFKTCPENKQLHTICAAVFSTEIFCMQKGALAKEAFSHTRLYKHFCEFNERNKS